MRRDDIREKAALFGNHSRFLNNELKVFIPAKYIPNDEVVTKPSGQKRYVLTRKIRLFDVSGTKQEIIANDATVFLVPVNNHSGDISSHEGDKELVWITDMEDLSTYLSDAIESEFDK